MANIYVRSSDGNDADNGSTWALAKASVAGASGAASIESAGDDILLAAGHSETYAANTTIALTGAQGTPTRIICVDDTGNPEPPTAASTGAVIETTGASNLIFTAAGAGQCLVLEGVRLRAGTANNAARIDLNSIGRSGYALKNCALECAGNAALSRISLVASNSYVGQFTMDDCWVKFANAGSYVSFLGALLQWRGGGLEAGGVSPTCLIGANLSGLGTAELSGLDLSAGAPGMVIFAAGNLNHGFDAYIRNSKLPASWSGGLVTNPGGAGAYRCEMHNCTSGATVYGLWVETSSGTIRDEQTIKRTGGAGESHKFVTGAGASYNFPLEGVEIVADNATTGTPITVSVEVVTDGVTLTDADCWLEVQYLASGGLSGFAHDGKANTLAAAANQTTSTADWTTTGLTSPVKQKLSVTFTPATAGFIHAVVKVAKPSTTVYVDPALTVA